MKKAFVLVWILIWAMAVPAQPPFRLNIEIAVQEAEAPTPGIMQENFFPSKAHAIKYILHVVDSIHQLGFLGCHQKTVAENDSSLTIQVITGLRYTWSQIDMDQIPVHLISGKTYAKLKPSNKNWTLQQCRSLMNGVLQHINGQGYPYAQVYLDSSRLHGNAITARLNVNSGPLVLLDTLEWAQDLKVKYSLMTKIIGFQSGSPFSRSAIEKINQSLSAYPFIEQYAEPDIFLSKNLARVKLYLRTRKSSKIDALLGLLPSSNGRLGINGTFRADFLNQLGGGERLVFDFQSLQSNSQDLNMRASAPFLFNLPFNPYFQFNLYKRDSLFLDVFGELGASVSLGGRGEIRFGLGQKSSSLLKPDLERIRANHQLPVALDLVFRHLGANFRFYKFDANRNPKSGFAFNLAITGSTREIVPHIAITNLKDPLDTLFSFASLYNPFVKNGYSFELLAEVEKYTRLGNFTTWHSILRSGIKRASTRLQYNEQYRLGGFRLMRGFDEESVFASDYYLWTNEYRLLTGDLSFIQVFSDVVLVNRFAENRFNYKTYWGLGSGLVFHTSLGLLSLSASVGKIFPDPFNLRNVKLHIGYINYF